ncbi:MAG: sensor domain-containing protein [Euryarchaeota archaeon]|nr:sensor domain-containing protein [Euryarchaeota archaeon]
MNETTDSIKHFFGVVAREGTYLNIIYLLLAFPLGTAYFVFLVTGLSLGISLLIIWIGIPILLFMIVAWWGLVVFERQLAIWLLHVDIPPISRETTTGQSAWVQLKAHLSKPLTWKGLVYLFARFPLGIFSFVVAFTLIALTGALVFAPLTYTDPESQLYIFSWQIDTFYETVICSIVGSGVGLISMHVMNGLAFVSGRFTSLMLGAVRDTNEILKEG